MQDVLICLLTRDAVLPKYANPGDRGADITIMQDPYIKWVGDKIGGEPVLCYPTGIRMYDPDQRSIFLYPRSSITTNTNLLLGNSVGVVDGGYLGELEFRFRLSGFIMPTSIQRVSYSLKGDELKLTYTERIGIDPYNKDLISATQDLYRIVMLCYFKVYKVGDKIGQIVIGDGSQVNFKVVSGEEFDTIVTQRESKGFGSTDFINQ